jgi:co-chaperonin GroES (HSP10)
MVNNFYLIKLKEENKILSNGISVKETRGKRDIVVGEVVKAPRDMTRTTVANEGNLVWFPLYSANSIVYDGDTLLIVQADDIIMVDVNAKQGGN